MVRGEERLSSRLQVMGWEVQWEGEREVMYLVWRETETRRCEDYSAMSRDIVLGERRLAAL